jgi:hypothetical protein
MRAGVLPYSWMNTFLIMCIHLRILFIRRPRLGAPVSVPSGKHSSLKFNYSGEPISALEEITGLGGQNEGPPKGQPSRIAAK